MEQRLGISSQFGSWALQIRVGELELASPYGNWHVEN